LPAGGRLGRLFFPELESQMDKKNPLLAGLVNMLIPGSGYWYVDHDRGRFLKALTVGIAAILAVLVVGILLQNTTDFPLPQGLCPGILLLIVLVPLFLRGQRAAVQHNFVQDSTSAYTARQHGSSQAQLAKNQSLRDKGLISEKEYDSRKDNLTSRKE
jgi:hypothetical protein